MQVLASSGYLELGMFDEATRALEEIAPEHESRVEVLGARLGVYMASRKWRMAAAVADQLVKVMPENPSFWIQMAYAVRRCETIDRAEAILLRAQEIHPRNVVILLNLASYASITGRIEEAKARLQHAIDLNRGARRLALHVEDLRPLWDWINGLD
jgi:Flp pilus assembly protein TadD